jgi:hypothetical protein
MQGRHMQFNKRMRVPLLLLQRDRHTKLLAGLERLCHRRVDNVSVQNLTNAGCVSEVSTRLDGIGGLLRGVRARTIL